MLFSADLGLIPRLVQLVKDGMPASIHVLCNLSRSDALLTMLKDAELLGAMQQFTAGCTEDSTDLAKVSSLQRGRNCSAFVLVSTSLSLLCLITKGSGVT